MIKMDILYILIWVMKFSSTLTLSMIVIPHIFLSFILSTPNNLFRCLAGSMGKGTGGKSGPSSPEGWWGKSLQDPCEQLPFAKLPEDVHGRPSWEEGAVERQE